MSLLAGLLVVAALLAAVLVAAGPGLGGPLSIVLLIGVVAAAAERHSVQVGPHAYTSVAAIPLVFTAVVYGPGAAMLVGACALLTDFRPPYARWLVWTTQRMIIGAVAGFVAAVSLSSQDSITWLLVAVVAASCAEAVLEVLFATATIGLRHPGRLQETLIALGRLSLSTVPLYTPVIAVLVFAYLHLSPWTVVLFAAPAAAAQRLLILYQDQRDLAEDLRHANTSLEGASLSFAAALVAALDARDAYTAGHSAAVAIYARDIASELGMSEGEGRRAHLAGLLHDIGKVALPPGILEKEGPLSALERSMMELHSATGERILAKVPDFQDIARVVRHHHERIDGRGYPDGLHGEEIPVMSRIIAVADAYNAMTSGRPYRRPLAMAVARSRLLDGCGTQFDANVVAAFERVLDRATEGYDCGVMSDFELPGLWRHADVAASAA